MSILLAYALITILLFSHNSAIEDTSKKVVKPISSCIALQHKLAYEKYHEKITTCINECIGITPKELVDYQNNEIIYHQSQIDDNEENMFDSDAALSILSQAVQQTIILNSMKSLNNYNQVGMYSVLSKCVEGLFYKEQTANELHNYTLLDNLLESNDLKRVIIPGDGNCSCTWLERSNQRKEQK